MTKKYYEMIAGALWRSKPLAILNPKIDAVRQSVYDMCVHNIADVCAADNPKFDRARFLKACGVAMGADDSHAERKIAKRWENS